MATIIVDCDDTVLDLVPVWLEMYNADYNDNLKIDNITDWNISLFVKKECGEKIYDYIKSPDIYYACKPIEGAKENIDKLRKQGHRVIFATVNNIDNCKYIFLHENGFLSKETKNDFIVTSDKSLIKGDIIVDDNPEHVLKFYGLSILVDRPWNKYLRKPERANNWNQIYNYIQTFTGVKI